jgi:DNA-binding response OmpR family regulator
VKLISSQTLGKIGNRTRKKILLVDDEPDITFTLRRGLEEGGMFEVDAFNDPQKALSSFKPDYYAYRY